MARVIGFQNGYFMGEFFTGTKKECWDYVERCEAEDEENYPEADVCDLMEYRVED